MKQVWKRLMAGVLAVMMIICMELTTQAASGLDTQMVFQCGANVTGILDIT